MRLALLALTLACPALLSATNPLTAARAEAAAAVREQERLEQRIAGARDAGARLQAEQAAAAQAIVAAEARLAVARVQSAALDTRLMQLRSRLVAEQRPAALLIGALAQAGRRPPLLALAGSQSLDDLVHLRALVLATLPALNARTAGLRQQLQASNDLARQAAATRTSAARQQQELKARQQRFATLEAQLNRRLAALGSEALGASDNTIARSAAIDTAAERTRADQQGRRNAAALLALAPPPPRPFPAAEKGSPADGFAWQLPVAGPLLSGLGEVSSGGVRSRGLTIGSPAGAAVVAPAAGTIVFAGPFRHHLSVLVLDHGGGWMTLLTEVRTALPRGARLAAGDPLGRSLGTVTVELSRNGRPQPAALIAGSSALLSNARQPS